MEKRGDISEKTPDLNAKLADTVVKQASGKPASEADLRRLDADFTKKAADRAAASI